MKTKITSLAFFILAVLLTQTGVQAQSYQYVPPVANQQVSPTDLANPGNTLSLGTASQTLPNVDNGLHSPLVNPTAAATYERGAGKTTGSSSNSDKVKCVEYLYTANGARGSCYQYSNAY